MVQKENAPQSAPKRRKTKYFKLYRCEYCKKKFEGHEKHVPRSCYHKKPICRECAENANRFCEQEGMPITPIHERAYWEESEEPEKKE